MSPSDPCSARLAYRPLATVDADALHALWIQPQVRRYLWDDRVIAPEQTLRILEQNATLFARRGFGLWGVRQPGAETLIGFCGFWHFRDPPELELLFGIHPSHWGAGLATEAARAMIDLGFADLGFTRIVGSADSANTASHRVMHKAGMQWLGEESRDGLPTVFYAIERPA